MKLSRQLGIPIKRLLNQIDSEELSLYLAAERISPMDDPWQRNALHCYVTGRAAGIKCKQSDFVPTVQKADDTAFKTALMGLANKSQTMRNRGQKSQPSA